MKKGIALMLVMVISNTKNYTFYSQNDPQWRYDQLGYGNDMICQAGSLISSLAMIMHTQGIQIDGKTTPQNLNTWGQQNYGFFEGNFIWASIGSLGFLYQGKVSVTNAKIKFDAGQHVILCVKNGSHFVLMTSYSGSTFYVHDSGFSKISYLANEIMNAHIYTSSNHVQNNNILKLK